MPKTIAKEIGRLFASLSSDGFPEQSEKSGWISIYLEPSLMWQLRNSVLDHTIIKTNKYYMKADSEETSTMKPVCSERKDEQRLPIEEEEEEEEEKGASEDAETNRFESFIEAETYIGSVQSIKSDNDDATPIKNEEGQEFITDETGTSIKKEENDDATLFDEMVDEKEEVKEEKNEALSENELDLRERNISPEEQRMEYEETAQAKLLKANEIRIACERGDRRQLRLLARSEYGLVSDGIRQVAWPILLGYDPDYTGETSPSWHDLPPHQDEEQVKLDVNRSFIYYPIDPSTSELQSWRAKLNDLIVEVLRRHPMLYYFQGFHDISQVVLLVLGPTRAVPALSYISLLRIRDYMLPSLHPAIAQISLLHPLLTLSDPKLAHHLSTTEPFFALAAMLTLYAHDIHNYSDAVRLFDVFLAEDPVFPVYFFAVIVLERKEELFDIPEEEPEMLHHILSKLPQKMRLDEFVEKAAALREKYPPVKLGAAWRRISGYSVLKTFDEHLKYTTTTPPESPSDENKEKQQTSINTNPIKALKLGEEYFRLQCRQLDREKMKKDVLARVYKLSEHRAMMLTVAVGISAVALGWYLSSSGKGGRHFGYEDLGRKIFAVFS